MKIRLEKYIAHAGVCSRRKAKERIKAGHVTVDGRVVSGPGTAVDPEASKIEIDGEEVALDPGRGHVYIALHKPRGVVSTCSRKHGKILLDLVDVGRRIYPVGRLDKDSSGLILMTDDGRLHLRLSHPSFNHEKEYVVKTSGPVTDPDLRRFAKGMRIDGVKTRKAAVNRISGRSFKIILKEGRNRQIRKMVSRTGNRVTRLKRVRMAGIRLGGLKPGAWRYLTPEEIGRLTD